MELTEALAQMGKLLHWALNDNRLQNLIRSQKLVRLLHLHQNGVFLWFLRGCGGAFGAAAPPCSLLSASILFFPTRLHHRKANAGFGISF